MIFTIILKDDNVLVFDNIKTIKIDTEKHLLVLITFPCSYDKNDIYHEKSYRIGIDLNKIKNVIGE